MPEPSRQLAAIMFTDIVGYTALGRDSAGEGRDPLLEINFAENYGLTEQWVSKE